MKDITDNEAGQIFSSLILSINNIEKNEFVFKLHPDVLDTLQTDKQIKDKFNWAIAWRMEHIKNLNKQVTLHAWQIEHGVECETAVVNYLISKNLISYPIKQ